MNERASNRESRSPAPSWVSERASVAHDLRTTLQPALPVYIMYVKTPEGDDGGTVTTLVFGAGAAAVSPSASAGWVLSSVGLWVEDAAGGALTARCVRRGVGAVRTSPGPRLPSCEIFYIKDYQVRGVPTYVMYT